MYRAFSPTPDDSASQLVSEPLSGVSGFSPVLSEEAFMQAMKTLQAVATIQYDPVIVGSLSDVPGGLKMYFDRVDRAREAGVKRINGVLQSMIRKSGSSGSVLGSVDAPRSVRGDSLDSVSGGSRVIGSFGRLFRPEEFRRPPLERLSSSLSVTEVCRGSSVSSGSSRRSRSAPSDGYCYLDLVREDSIREAMQLREWPPLGALLSCPASWFRFPDLLHWYLKGSGSRVHVVPRGRARPAHLVGDAFGQLSLVASSAAGTWPLASLGFQLVEHGSFSSSFQQADGATKEWLRGPPSSLSAATLVGGEGVGVDDSVEVETVVRKAVVDFLVSDCYARGASRSRLWEAAQLAGSSVDAVDGRALMSGNKLLGMIGDSVLKTALLARTDGLRIGDAQAVVSDVLSNGSLGRVGRMFCIQSVLQGSIQGNASDYVLATAVEAVAGACYYGGGIRCVDQFLLKVLEFSGLGFKYPSVYQAAPDLPAG